MVVAGVDIVVREQLEFAERVNSEGRGPGVKEVEGKKVELMVIDGCWHGWLESKYYLAQPLSLRRVFSEGLCIR